MKLVSFGVSGSEQPGVLCDDDTIVPLGGMLGDLGLPGADMNGVLGLLPFLRPLIDELIGDPAHATRAAFGDPSRPAGSCAPDRHRHRGQLPQLTCRRCPQ